MSIFLHGAKPSSQILPEEKRVNRDHFGTKIDKGGTFGEQMLMFLSNYESLDREISHRLCKSQKRFYFSKLCVLPNFYPNLPIFLHGLIRHIRDILHLCRPHTSAFQCLFAAHWDLFVCNRSIYFGGQSHFGSYLKGCQWWSSHEEEANDSAFGELNYCS